MEIPQRLLKKWKLQKERGDIEKIAEQKNLSPLTVSNAFKKGRALKATIKAINDFYKEKPEQKKKEEKKLLAEID